ncbi:MAG: putative Ig domain-containing protein, partial [Nanoarchaeota archaeon]
NIQNFTFNLTNNFTATGAYTLKLIVADNNSNSATQEWQVTVTNTNREPILDQVSNKNVNEDSTLKFNITALDPDGDSLIFISNVSSITFTSAANNSLATANWTPTNDNVGSNSVEFIVKDSSKNASQTITITVTNTNDDPTITDFFPLDNRTIAKNVGIQKFNVTFKDVDAGDDATAYWFRNTTLIAPNSSNVTVTSLLEGIYNITAIVNDTTGAKARYEWKLIVTTDVTSENLTSPVLQLNETQRQNVTNVTINQSAFGGIDFGNNTLNFSGVVRLEDAFNISKGFVSINSKAFQGLNKSASLVMRGINFTKAPLIYRAPEFKSTANGIVCPENVCTNITYDAAKGILRFRVPGFSTYFTQTNTTNGAPIITSAPSITAAENAKYTYDAEATDPDGDVLTFSLTTKPSGMSISSSTGVISWTPAASQLGSNNVTVSVSDGSLTAEQNFNITVGKGPRLIISDLDVKVDTKTDKGIQNNTKISKEAAPGSRVEFKLEIENLFTDDEDLEIEDIDVEITIEDIDDGDDLDGDID